MKNDGINIGGNAKVKIDNAAVGAHSIITVTTYTVESKNNEIEKLSKLFDSLTEKINTTSEHIPAKDDVVASVASLKEEIHKERPNKITLSGVGKAVLENLKYVKDIAPIAEAMWHQITSLII